MMSACSPPPKVAVVERATVDERVIIDKMGGAHIRIVQSGDTLHAIAFANGLNVNDLADWNQLDDTSKLRVGYRIRLTRPVGYSSNRGVNRSTSKGDVSIPQKPATNTESNSKPNKLIKTKSLNTAGAKGQNLLWHWPTRGKVITRFAENTGQQGIDIAGKLGQAVVATSAGEVVYVGNGLKGYGNLVIIKHNEKYLSAYAHNQETFVREGQNVAVNYRIASLGKNRQQRDALHFQIRLNGQPVDPLKYLSAK
jgi:lipoprotein NlpD